MLPEARAVSVERDGRSSSPDGQRHEAGFFVARLDGAAAADYRLRDRDRRRHRPARRSLSLRLLSSTARTSAACARSAATTVCRACSARTARSSMACRASASRCGRRTRAGSAWSAISTAGTAAAIRCACATTAASGSCSSPASTPASATSSRSRAPTARSPLKADPLAFAAEQPPATASVLHGLPESDAGATKPGWRARGAGDPRKRRCRSTSAISARGRACRRRATAISPIASWPSG